MDFTGFKSDGTVEGTSFGPSPESRAVVGEELWWGPQLGTAGVAVTQATALQSPAFLAGVKVIAEDVATLPLNVFQRMPDGSKRSRPDHRAEYLLDVSPDGETTPRRWRAAWMGHALTRRGGYAEIQRTGRGAPYALHLLDPETTHPRRSEGALWYHIAGGDPIPAQNVLHIAGFGHDGLTGYDTIRMTQQALGLALAEQSYACDFFANGAEPGYALKHPKVLSKAAKDNLRESVEDRHMGPGKRFRVAIFEEGMEPVKTGSEPDKAQLLEARKFQVLEQLRVLRVPPHKAGDMSEAHLRNYESSALDYLVTALMTWLVEIEQTCRMRLFSRAEIAAGLYVEHNLNALLRGDVKSRFEAYAMAIRDGWQSRNEVRRKENLNPIPADQGGDLYTVQAQVVPLDKAGVAFDAAADPTPDPGPADAQPLQIATSTPANASAPLGPDPIFDLKRLLNDAATGQLPVETVKAVILASYPYTAAQVDAMLAPLTGFEPKA